ncbi:hypothetical protein HELRODRAFT_177898 [Helobdella robusta]|uniref:WSC domain-containing protein n=1 Tax=Helobdella robusta TaxID=6412 RepID=T1FCG0_HELRO|nr:hypothetical protein HELRODRAFT_177898 [Helobdella robusta]ESN97477.1 hypothetical protein HELRODRAFT_177898 [Helobdella robusta]
MKKGKECYCVDRVMFRVSSQLCNRKCKNGKDACGGGGTYHSVYSIKRCMLACLEMKALFAYISGEKCQCDFTDKENCLASAGTMMTSSKISGMCDNCVVRYHASVDSVQLNQGLSSFRHCALLGATDGKKFKRDAEDRKNVKKKKRKSEDDGENDRGSERSLKYWGECEGVLVRALDGRVGDVKLVLREAQMDAMWVVVDLEGQFIVERVVIYDASQMPVISVGLNKSLHVPPKKSFLSGSYELCDSYHESRNCPENRVEMHCYDKTYAARYVIIMRDDDDDGENDEDEDEDEDGDGVGGVGEINRSMVFSEIEGKTTCFCGTDADQMTSSQFCHMTCRHSNHLCGGDDYYAVYSGFIPRAKQNHTQCACGSLLDFKDQLPINMCPLKSWSIYSIEPGTLMHFQLNRRDEKNVENSTKEMNEEKKIKETNDGKNERINELGGLCFSGWSGPMCDVRDCKQNNGNCDLNSSCVKVKSDGDVTVECQSHFGHVITKKKNAFEPTTKSTLLNTDQTDQSYHFLLHHKDAIILGFSLAAILVAVVIMATVVVVSDRKKKKAEERRRKMIMWMVLRRRARKMTGAHYIHSYVAKVEVINKTQAWRSFLAPQPMPTLNVSEFLLFLCWIIGDRFPRRMTPFQPDDPSISYRREQGLKAMAGFDYKGQVSEVVVVVLSFCLPPAVGRASSATSSYPPVECSDSLVATDEMNE